MTSLQELLSSTQVEASAPCRIDSGGTWDIKALALPCETIRPITVNMALNLRTSVVLSPFDHGWIKISSEGFPRAETFSKDLLPFNSPYGLFLASVSYFDFHGVEIHINSQSPVRSALGGSSTALVALIKAFAKVSQALGAKVLSRREILHLAYHIEDGISGGNCGPQDQAAAVYGGVNSWTWIYGDRSGPLRRRPLLDRQGQKELSKHLLVIYSGKSHTSSRTNSRWTRDFLSGRTRAGWVKANEIVHRISEAIEGKDWRHAAQLLQQEMHVRREMTPEALIPLTERLVQQAEAEGCGARFAGAGAGGCVWAIGETEDLDRLREIWRGTLEPVKDAGILGCAVDPLGVR
jgi:D-glycero-alpha-D-manno-heptose-7-phosphate kinase